MRKSSDRPLPLTTMTAGLAVAFWLLDTTVQAWILRAAPPTDALLGTGGHWFGRLLFAGTVVGLGWVFERVLAAQRARQRRYQEELLRAIDELRDILNHVLRMAEFGAPTPKTLDEIQRYVFEAFLQWDERFETATRRPGVLLFKRPRSRRSVAHSAISSAEGSQV